MVDDLMKEHDIPPTMRNEIIKALKFAAKSGIVKVFDRFHLVSKLANFLKSIIEKLLGHPHFVEKKASGDENLSEEDHKVLKSELLQDLHLEKIDATAHLDKAIRVLKLS